MTYAYRMGIMVTLMITGISLYCTLAEKLIVVVVPSYNNAEWYERNLTSIFMQEYNNYYIIYIDDASTDHTADLVNDYVNAAGQQDRFVLIRNMERKGHLYNHIHAVNLIEDYAIVVHIDGDDWLPLNEYRRIDIFSTLNEIYEDPQVWLTYGSYYRYPFGNLGTCKEFPQEVILNSGYRAYPEWISSHLRTFYAWLFKQIDPADFIYTGSRAEYQHKYWPAAADLSFMFPMLEMAQGRYKYIPDVIYAYNRANVLNLCIGDMQPVQQECAKRVREKKPYQGLDETIFWYFMGAYRESLR